MKTNIKTKNKKKLKQLHRAKRFTFLAMLIVGIVSTLSPSIASSPEQRNNFLPRNADKAELTIQDKIMIASMKTDIPMHEALDVAHCESRFKERARSGISSATGVFQFIARTWFDYCEGDPKNADDNIKCFMELYPKHKSWWECSKILNYI